MPGLLSSSRNTAIAVLVLLAGGFLLTRYLGRRMGDARRSALGDVNRVLAELAATMGGQFDEGPKLTDHPILGELRTYGTAHLTRGPLAIDVSVSYPADDLRDDRTTVRVRLPAERHWRVTALHQRQRAPASIDPGAVEAQLTRCFAIAGGEPLPLDARDALLQVGAQTFSLDVAGDTLDLIAAADGDTVYIADVARLRGLIEEVVRLAEALLVPAAV